MLILNLQPSVDNNYFEPNFLVIIESHLTSLRTSDGGRYVEVTEQQGFKYEGDFFGLLDDLSVDKNYHHIVLRVNDLYSSADYKGNLSHVLLPSFPQIDMLKSIYQTEQYTVQ